MLIQSFLEKYRGQQAFLVSHLEEFIKHIKLIMPLINSMSNITFFIKNREARYQLVNDHFLERSGLQSLEEIIDRTSTSVFQSQFGSLYEAQDFKVIETGSHILNRLELHTYNNGSMGWCMTTKIPITDINLKVVGIVGISVDLQDDKLVRTDLNVRLNRVLDYVSENFFTQITTQELAEIAHLSVSQLNRQFREIFLMTPLQLIQKKRFEHAIHLLSQDLSITEVSMQCGYIDHSAFSRKFKEVTNMTPTEFKLTLAS